MFMSFFGSVSAVQVSTVPIMLSKVNFQVSKDFRVKLTSLHSQVLILAVLCAFALGAPAIYNHPNNYHPNRGYLTPPRAITTLNTFVPRRLIPPAPARAAVPRVYENPQPRVYTAPTFFRPIPPAPTTRRPYAGNTYASNTYASNANAAYAFNYGVNDNRVNRSNYREFPGVKYCNASPPLWFLSGHGDIWYHCYA